MKVAAKLVDLLVCSLHGEYYYDLLESHGVQELVPRHKPLSEWAGCGRSSVMQRNQPTPFGDLEERAI